MTSPHHNPTDQGTYSSSEDEFARERISTGASSSAGRASETQSHDERLDDMQLSDKEQFARLLANHERRIYAYVLSLVPNWADADEIVQETNVRLWRDFDRFDRDTNFGSWAMSIAYYQVLTWRKRMSRNRLVFDDDTLNIVAECHEQSTPLAEARFRALRECFHKLSDRNRDLLLQCYAPGVQIKDLTERLGRTRSAIYKALQRIRATLRICIDRRIREDQRT